MTRRILGGAALGVIAAVAAAGVAHADAAGPTDYRSEIVSITPATEAVSVMIEGGDSFVAIDVAPGHEVVVLGYDGEPYLLVDGEGEVFRNRRSFATYYNEDRYGNDDAPDIVDNTAPPEWDRVGGGGTWAWHDHRAHWMGTEPPIGLSPGDSLPSQIVPIEVDGTSVAIEVRTTLLAEPSLWPAAFGLLIGLSLALVAGLAGPATLNLVALAVAAVATWVGVAQYRSLPSETEPLVTWWLLPVMALVAALAVIAVYGRSALLQLGLLALAGLQLTLWAVRRRSGLTTAWLPTDAPFWFDRAVTAIALAAGVVIVVIAVREIVAPRVRS